MNKFLEGEIVLCTHKDRESGLKAGHPSIFIETSNDATVFEEPTLFLDREFASSGATPSPHTWAAAGQALKTWFQYLQAIEKDWQAATAQDRIDYRDAYQEAISPRTGDAYEASTIAARMSVIRDFYVYAWECGWYHGDIGAIGSIEHQHGRPIDQDAMAHARVRARQKERDRDLPKSRPKVAIHPIAPKGLRALLHHAGPQAAQSGADQRYSRNRLIFDLGWAVGLRVSEIAGLTTLQFLTLTPDLQAPYSDQQLIIVRKGGKKASVAIPTWLVMDILAYIDGERADAMRAAKISSRSHPVALFLSQPGSSRQGRPITINRLQGIFEEACISLGLTELRDFMDPETGQVAIRKRARHSIHDLRHTYAVLTYHAERANGNSEPWKKIQAQLGHEHLQTTIDTYLHHVEIFTEQPGLLNVRRMIGL